MNELERIRRRSRVLTWLAFGSALGSIACGIANLAMRPDALRMAMLVVSCATLLALLVLPAVIRSLSRKP